MLKKSKQIQLLIDSSVQFSDVKIFLKQNPSTHVIAFDFKSHQFLNHEKIPHDISDTFLDDNERTKLQSAIFKFSKWYEHTDIKNILEYDGVNIGKLYYIELSIFLIPFLKKFFELQNFLLKNNDKIYASGLIYEILSKSNIDVSIFQTKSTNSEFLYDSITLQNNFMKIKLPKKFFSNIKFFSEIFLNIFSSINKKPKPNSIFLVEFNTILYENVLLEIHKNNLNSVYFGTRRPSIWNTKSYSIINESRCHVANNRFIFNLKLERSIKLHADRIKSKWKYLFENDDFFNSFFCYDKKTFWTVLKPFFIQLYESRLQDSIKTIHFAKEYLIKTNASNVLVFSESGTSEQIIISLAKNLGIPVILIQHGLVSFDSKESDILNAFTGSMPISSDKFFVWGEAMKQYALNFGIPNEKIFVSGSCAHDNLFNNYHNSDDQDYILFSPESPSNNHINDYTVSVNEEYEKILKAVCTIASKLNKKLIIKLHPYINELNETKISKSIDPDIKIIKKGDMFSLVKSCSLFITSGITSAMIDAAYLKKPIIRIQTREWWGQSDTLRTDSAITTHINNLENIVNQIFSDPKYHQNAIQNGVNFVDDCISHPGLASKNISQFLGTNTSKS